MSKAFADIEKQCLSELHRGNTDVCKIIIGENGKTLVSDCYAVWVFDKDFELGMSFVRYPNNEKMVNKIPKLVEKYERIGMLTPLYETYKSVVTRNYTASEYENYSTGDSVWIQDKYINLFKPFMPEFCTYPDWDENRPIVVRSGQYMIGLVMAMHITEECKANKIQGVL